MLTPEVEAEIVRLTVEDKLVAREVAAMYGIGDRHVRDIVHRELGHVDRRKQGWTTPKTRDRTKRILEAKARGETIADIARAEGCHTETIYRALRKA
jgi:transposase-like protein